MSSLVQILYVSRAVGAELALPAILTQSRPRNAAAGITGFLFAGPDTFAQVLEGPDAAVAATFARIGGDPRHADVAVLGRRSLRTRSFARWSMGSCPPGAIAESILVRHGLRPGFEPGETAMPVLLALAMDLQDAEPA